MKTMKQLLVIRESSQGEIDPEYATIFDVCEWWIDTYPEDIFVGDDKGAASVSHIREQCQKILAMTKEKK